MRVLFVCTGNTCRSPMAEALLKTNAEKRGLKIEVGSAGIFALDGDRASRGAMEVMKDISSLGGHRARTLDKEMLKWADMVLVMTQSQIYRIESQYPEMSDKLHLLKKYAFGEDSDIEDPYGGSISMYRKVRDELDKSINAILDKIMK